jgi:hypothetical protein
MTNKTTKETTMNILDVFKKNEVQLRSFGCAFNDVEEIEEHYEEKYNPFTKRKIDTFLDCDFFNGSAPTVLNFIADEMTKMSNRKFRVYSQPDLDFGCMVYKVE